MRDRRDHMQRAAGEEPVDVPERPSSGLRSASVPPSVERPEVRLQRARAKRRFAELRERLVGPGDGVRRAAREELMRLDGGGE